MSNTLDDEAFDGMLMNIIQRNRGIAGYFDAIYGMLRRKTDFFSNFKEAEKQITEGCRRHAKRFTEEQAKKAAVQKKKDAKKAAREADKIAKKLFAQKKAEEEAAKKAKAKGGEGKVEEEKVEEKDAKKDGAKKGKVEESKEEEDEEKKNLQKPVENGGTAPGYRWTQSLDELHVLVEVDSNTKGKQVKVDYQVKTLTVAINGEEVINGELYEKISRDECVWTLETFKGKKFLDVNLVKWPKAFKWWDCVILGHPKIDCQAINPESSSIADLDDDMKPTVEKMMFDMRQKQAGKPSSDELKKQEMLKGFMSQHPEMDFSNCKFN